MEKIYQSFVKKPIVQQNAKIKPTKGRDISIKDLDILMLYEAFIE